MDIKIPVRVKIEQPEVYVDYPGEDMSKSFATELLQLFYALLTFNWFFSP